MTGYDYDKYYVGITSRPVNQRWLNGNGYKKNEHFHRAIEKYGWDNFEHEIVAEHLTKNEACNFEKTLIKLLNSNDYHYGYNICSGGEGATGLYGDKNPNYDKHWSKEKKNNMSEYKKLHPSIASEKGKKSKSDFMKSKWNDEEYRKSMTGENAPCYGRTGDKHPLFGKIGEQSACSKKVICLNTGEIFASATDASKSKGINHSKLCMCCRGERKSCGKDNDGNPLRWKYYSDYIEENEKDTNSIRA